MFETRGATLIHGFDPVHLRRSCNLPATDVCPHVAASQALRLLGAPSAAHSTSRISSWLPPSQARCARVNAYFSASTVSSTRKLMV